MNDMCKVENENICIFCNKRTQFHFKQFGLTNLKHESENKQMDTDAFDL